MTPIAPHIEAYLRAHLGHQRGASPHTCESYAHSFQRLFEFAAKRPKLYHALGATIAPLLARLAGSRGRFSTLPFAGAWTHTRDLPAPQGKTFHELYRETQGSESQ